MKEENFTRAEYVFTQALKKNNSYWRAHFNKGNALIGLGKNKEAKKSFKFALKYAPEIQKQKLQNSLQAVQ